MQKRIYLLTILTIGLMANAQTYTGKVGINTDTPSATLDIVSAGNDGTTKALEINNTDSPSKEMVTVLNNGNVGINIPTPAQKLHVGGHTWIGDPTNGKYGSLYIDYANATNGGGALVLRKDKTYGTVHWTINQFGGNGTSANPPRFRIYAGNNELKGISINENGFMGINTSAPTNNLHVIATTNPVRFEGLQNGANSNEIVSVDANGVLYKNTLQNIAAGNFWALNGNSGTTAGTNFLGTTDNQDLIFKRNSVYSGWIGDSNTSFGSFTLNMATNTGLGNNAFGDSALRSNTSGGDNEAFGSSALSQNTTGTDNTAIGSYSLNSNTSGFSNIALGSYTLYNNTTGNSNIGLGQSTLTSNTTGNSNIGIGANSLPTNTTGIRNIGIGELTLFNNTTGGNSIAMGYGSLQANTTGGSNVAIGFQTMNTGNGHDNTAIGSYAMKSQNGNFNVAVGSSAGSSSSGNYNNTIFMGVYSGLNLASGDNNIGIGTSSFAGLTNGADNIGIGAESGNSMDGGSYNIFIGRHSGASAPSGTSIAVNRSAAIGYNASVNQDDSIVIGNSDPATKIGIATTAPKSRLHIGTGDVYIEEVSKGIIMKSPDGTCYRVTVANGGGFTSAAITCP